MWTNLSATKSWLLTWLEILFKAMPSLVIIGYCLFCYHLFGWYSHIPNPTTQQTTFATAIFGLGSAVFGLYINSGIKWNDHLRKMKEEVRKD